MGALFLIIRFVLYACAGKLGMVDAGYFLMEDIFEV